MTFAVLAVGVGAFALLQSLVAPVLTTVQTELDTSQNAVTWVLTAYLLSASIFTPIMGRLGDMVGKERVFVATLAAVTAGSVLAAVATSIEVMILARVIQGIGGGMVPLAFGILRDEFPRERLAGAVGMLAALSAAGAGLGIVLAGPIVGGLGYRWLFWLPTILTALAGIAAAAYMPESPVRAPGRIAWLPATFLSGWLVALLIALSQGSDWGWSSGRVLALLSAAAVIATLWVKSELRAETPLIDMTMMRRPAVWTANLVAFLIGVGMYATFAFLPQFVQTPTAAGYGFGSSVTQAGLMLLPLTVTMFVVSTVAGRVAARVGGKVLVVGGCVVGVVAMLLLAFAHSQQWEIYLATGLMGVGFGIAFAAMSALIVVAVPPEQTGVASGMNANLRTIGGSIGAALMTSVVTSNLAVSGVPREAGYTNGFILLAGALVLATVASLLIPGRPTATTPVPDDATLAADGAQIGSGLGTQHES